MEPTYRQDRPDTALIRVWSAAKFLLVAVVLGISYSLSPLYSSNQNTYFLHGLADGGMGFLSHDWLAETADPFPVFSYLVELTYRYLPQWFFHVYYVLILGVYAYGITGITSKVFKIDSSKTKYWIYVVTVIGLHSAALSNWSSLLTGVDLRYLVTFGVADQYVLGPVFQPSVFGVFLILSIYSFLRGQPILAVICTGIASSCHSTYLLSAAVLTVSYIVLIIRRDRDIRRAALTGLVSFLTVLPILAYVYVSFSPTSAETSGLAQSILVDYRIPHHAQVAAWFGPAVLLRILIVVTALFLVRKHRIIFTVLLFSATASVVLTLVQLITGSSFLALLFPWRLSAFLVPLSTCLIAGSAVSASYTRFENWIDAHHRMITIGILSVAAVLVVRGTQVTWNSFSNIRAEASAPAMNFVADVRNPLSVYLIPPELQGFRLSTGAPVFVDYKTHPYRDIELLQWYDRLKLAERYYAASGDSALVILQDITSRYEITHVLERTARSVVLSGRQQTLYRDGNFTVYEMPPSDDKSLARTDTGITSGRWQRTDL